jgi:uncharacterized protein (TIGR03067 family)
MKVVMVGFVAGAVLLAAGQGDEAAQKKEKARLQGEWKVAKLETSKGGVEEDFVGARFTIGEAGTIELQKGGETKKATFTINPAAKPKEMDITPEGKDVAMKAIYQLEKDKLQICLEDDPNGPRPTEFAVKEGSRQVLIMLERSK